MSHLNSVSNFKYAIVSNLQCGLITFVALYDHKVDGCVIADESVLSGASLKANLDGDSVRSYDALVDTNEITISNGVLSLLPRPTLACELKEESLDEQF